MLSASPLAAQKLNSVFIRMAWMGLGMAFGIPFGLGRSERRAEKLELRGWKRKL